MSEKQFATALGVSRAAVQQWEKPGGTAPKRSNQPRVAALLGTSVAELMSGGANSEHGFDVRIKVPIVSEVEAGNYTAIDNFSPRGSYDVVPVGVPVQRHTYALRVHGDTMVSEFGDSFPEGSLIIVEPDLKAEPGDYVIALSADHKVTFKQLIEDGGEFFLKPLNARYPIRPLGSAEIVGVVREVTKRFR